MPLIRRRQDFGLLLSLLKMSDSAGGINLSLAAYCLRKELVSSNKLIAALYTWRLYREFERLNFFKSFYYFTHYFVRAMFRHKLPKLAKRVGLFG